MEENKLDNLKKDGEGELPPDFYKNQVEVIHQIDRKSDNLSASERNAVKNKMACINNKINKRRKKEKMAKLSRKRNRG